MKKQMVDAALFGFIGGVFGVLVTAYMLFATGILTQETQTIVREQTVPIATFTEEWWREWIGVLSGWAAAIAAIFVGIVSIRPVMHSILEKKKETSIAELQQANSLLQIYQDTLLEMFQPGNNIIEKELRKLDAGETAFDTSINKELNSKMLEFQQQFLTISKTIEEYWAITQPLGAGLEAVEFEASYIETTQFLNVFSAYWAYLLTGNREFAMRNGTVTTAKQVLDQLRIVHATLLRTVQPAMHQLSTNRMHIRDIRKVKGMF